MPVPVAKASLKGGQGALKICQIRQKSKVLF